jgi:hypothetical protein
MASSVGVQPGGSGAARLMPRHTQVEVSHRPTQPSASSDSRYEPLLLLLLLLDSGAVLVARQRGAR